MAVKLAKQGWWEGKDPLVLQRGEGGKGRGDCGIGRGGLDINEERRSEGRECVGEGRDSER